VNAKSIAVNTTSIGSFLGLLCFYNNKKAVTGGVIEGNKCIPIYLGMIEKTNT
jgi:hypothetical protein